LSVSLVGSRRSCRLRQPLACFLKTRYQTKPKRETKYMNVINWVFVFSGITVMAFGIYTFGIGVWGLVKNRPLIFATRQYIWFLFAMIAPVVVVLSNNIFEEREHVNLFLVSMSIFQAAMLVLMAFILWRQMSGYMILGVSDETFRNALLNALNKLNFPFQESISKIKLTSPDADLQATVASGMGTAQIRIKQQQYIRYTKDIANAMNEYYKSNPVKVNNFTFIIFLLLGILTIAFVIVFSIFGYSFMFGSF
jgi:hypothetical protein